MNSHDPGSPSAIGDRPRSVLILTAAVGGGHEALASSIARELLETGQYTIVTRDGPRDVSRLLAWSLRAGYLFQLKHATWTIGPVFAFKTHRYVAPRLRALYGFLYGRRLLETVRLQQPDVVISTYPIVTAVLDALRRSNRICIPVVTAIADYGVHDLWVGPETTMHLVASDLSRRLVQAAGGRATIVRMPVDVRFDIAVDRSAMRARLGLPRDKTIVLLAAGAWGVGDLAPVVRGAMEAGAYPIVITGKNEASRIRLARRFANPADALILGWTEAMPEYLAAADCLIQNGGGMTCHEAAAMGVPVLFFRPLPGHGRRNADVMEAAGVTWRLASERALGPAIERIAAGDHPDLVPRSGMSIAGAVADAVRTDPALRIRSRPVQRAYGRVGFATMMLLACWLLLTPWTGGTVDFMMPPVANASTVEGGSVILAIRLSTAESAIAIQEAAEEARTPVVLFVQPSAMDGIRQSPYVQYGLSQEPYRQLISHPDDAWRATRTASTRIRSANESDLLYVLGAERGRTVAATAMIPGRVTMLAMSKPPEAVEMLDLAHSTTDEAVERFHRELARLAEEGLSCVFLPADSLPA